MPSLSPFFALLLAVTPARHPGDIFGKNTEHPAAISLLDLRFTADEMELGLRLQELTLREVPRWLLDTDLSGTISNFELEQAWDRVASLVEESLWLELDGEIIHPEFVIAAYEGIGATLADGSFHFDYVQLRAKIPRPHSLDAARIHSDLFLEDGNPKHTLMITVEGLSAERIHTLLKGEQRDYDFSIPSTVKVFGQYAELGWQHVLIGWDHLAFLVALLFGVACLADLLWAVTAFTVAHSVTLALAALDVFSLPAMVVEPGIALSVLAVLTWHLRRGATRSRAWIPAFIFGLLHGFGFASVLGGIGLPPAERTLSLLGFNAGVELGQLTFVIPVVLLVLLVKRTTATHNHRKLRELLALPALAFAMYLVGNAAATFWFEGTLVANAPAARVIGMVCATLFCLVPGGDSASRKTLRRLTWQAALLLVCFSLGQQLRA